MRVGRSWFAVLIVYRRLEVAINNYEYRVTVTTYDQAASTLVETTEVVNCAGTTMRQGDGSLSASRNDVLIPRWKHDQELRDIRKSIAPKPRVILRKKAKVA